MSSAEHVERGGGDLAESVAELLGRVAALELAVGVLQGRGTPEGALASDAPDGEASGERSGASVPAGADDPREVELEALRAKNAQLLADYERIEGEHQALKLQHELGGGAPEAPAQPASNMSGRAKVAQLEFRVTKLTTENEALTQKIKQLKEGGASTGPADAPTAGVPDATAEALASLQAEHAHLESEYKALEARLAAVASAQPTIDVAAIPVDDPTEVRHVLEQIVVQNAQLTSRYDDVEREVARVKDRATRRIKALKDEADVAKRQKDNLLRELASRDASGAATAGSGELTLEQITASPVFKTMLGNIRRTSREEVTLLHDSVVDLGKVDPGAYNAVLEVVNARFTAARVENPLALLPRLEVR